jgi:hypothetical protein
MLTVNYCEDRAVICEMLARQTADPALAREWLLMADDWRRAASSPLTAPQQDLFPWELERRRA